MSGQAGVGQRPRPHCPSLPCPALPAASPPLPAAVLLCCLPSVPGATRLVLTACRASGTLRYSSLALMGLVPNTGYRSSCGYIPGAESLAYMRSCVCFHWELQLNPLDDSQIHHPIRSWVAHTNKHRSLDETQVPCTHCMCHFCAFHILAMSPPGSTTTVSLGLSSVC